MGAEGLPAGRRLPRSWAALRSFIRGGSRPRASAQRGGAARRGGRRRHHRTAARYTLRVAIPVAA